MSIAMDTTTISHSFFLRLRQYIWLLLFVVLALICDQWRIISILQQPWSQEVHIFVMDCVAWGLIIYLLVVSIPWRWLRRVVVSITMVGLTVLYLTDIYLLYTYSMPYEDTMAQPLLGTNPKEAVEFLQTLSGSWGTYIVEFSYLLVAFFFSFGVSLLVNKLHRLLQKYPLNKIPYIRHVVCYKHIASFFFWGVLLLYTVHFISVKGAYKNNWLWYNKLSLPERLVFSNKFVKKEIALSNIYYHPRAAKPEEVAITNALPPHNVVVIYTQEMYPSLMACYNDRGVPNTPYMSERIADGSLIRFENAHSKESSAQIAALTHFSLAPVGQEQYWDSYPTLAAVLRTAGYQSYWLSNTPKVEPWLDILPQMAADCDSSYFTNLRASASEWRRAQAPDIDVLKHLSSLSVDGKSQYQVIHLMGAAGIIWSHTSDELSRFYRESVKSTELLSESEQDDLGQYYTIALNQDYIVEEVIKHYEETPCIVIYLGNMGTQWQPNPYSREIESEEELTRVPLLVYLSPEMKKLNPTLESSVRTLASQYFDTHQFAPQLLALLGITYTPFRGEPSSK